MEACPSLEDVAAFLDRMLTAEERERVAAHLAGCESCYAVFAEAAQFELDMAQEAEGGGEVVPFPFEDDRQPAPERLAPAAASAPSIRRKPAPWWYAAAALVVLGLGTGITYQTYFVQPEMSVAELVEPVEAKSNVGQYLYEGITYRGDEETARLEDPAHDVMVGVRLVNLGLSARAKDVARASSALQNIGKQLDSFIDAKHLQKRYYDDFSGLDLRGVPQDQALARLARIAGELPAREKELEEAATWPGAIDFGKWAAAGHVAAQLPEPEFFENGKNRRFLRWLLRQPEKEEGILRSDNKEDQQVLLRLQEIQRLWDAEQRDYKGLATAFDAIIDHYDHLANQDEEELIGLPPGDEGI